MNVELGLIGSDRNIHSPSISIALTDCHCNDEIMLPQDVNNMIMRIISLWLYRFQRRRSWHQTVNFDQRHAMPR